MSHESHHSHGHASAGVRAFDTANPHDDHGGHNHGHVIVSKFTNRLVLIALLFFTVLTVGAAQLEVFIMDTFDIVLPHWVNILVALSIAVVKSTLVLLFFMQLRYDNPINGIIFAFTILTLGIFLFFTMGDLANRDRIYDYRGKEINTGGMNFVRWKMASTAKDENGNVIAEQVTNNLVAHARQKLLDKVGPEEFARLAAEAHGHYGHHDEGPANSASRSRPRRGVTSGLFEAHAGSHGAGGHGSGSHSSSSHGSDGHEAAPSGAEKPAGAH
ncbi:MAG: cytochrome C oxidase subunit IV family protein [Planctomycetota bacterium]|nr:cytochrome C oxidase subunit IV family protein [Planctomycetota bacterium]